MITIQTARRDDALRRRLEKLDELLVSYRLEVTEGLEHPVLKEGDQSFTGAEAIDAYLKKLEEDVEAWRAPGCGK